MKPIGLQLYTLREWLGESKEEFLKTMRWVSDTGFRGVEGGLSNAVSFGMTAQDYKGLLDDLGLKLVTGPGPKADLSNLDEIKQQKELFGFKHLFGGFGWDEFKTMDRIRSTADTVNKMVDALKPLDLKLGLHNHFWEYDEIGGKLGIDHIAEMCPDVFFEIDIYWATNFGKHDAAEQVARFKDRIAIMHVKDGTMEGHSKENPHGGPMCAAGQGVVNIEGAVKAADDALLEWLIVEIDRCKGDRFEATKQSIDYLVAAGLGE